MLEGLVYELLQSLLHSFDQSHLCLQLLIGRVQDELVASTSLSQSQAFVTDLQRNDRRVQCLLHLLLTLSQHTQKIRSKQPSDIVPKFCLLFKIIFSSYIKKDRSSSILPTRLILFTRVLLNHFPKLHIPLRV